MIYGGYNPVGQIQLVLAAVLKSGQRVTLIGVFAGLVCKINNRNNIMNNPNPSDNAKSDELLKAINLINEMLFIGNFDEDWLDKFHEQHDELIKQVALNTQQEGGDKKVTGEETREKPQYERDRQKVENESSKMDNGILCGDGCQVRAGSDCASPTQTKVDDKDVVDLISRMQWVQDNILSDALNDYEAEDKRAVADLFKDIAKQINAMPQQQAGQPIYDVVGHMREGLLNNLAIAESKKIAATMYPEQQPKYPAHAKLAARLRFRKGVGINKGQESFLPKTIEQVDEEFTALTELNSILPKHPVAGDSFIYDGTKFIHFFPSVPNVIGLFNKIGELTELNKGLEHELDARNRIIRTTLLRQAFRHFGSSSDPEIKKKRFDYMEEQEKLMLQEAYDCINRLNEAQPKEAGSNG